MARPEAYAETAPEHETGEAFERAFKVAETDLAENIHSQSLDLMELGPMRGVSRVTAVDAPRREHAQGRLAAAQNADLNARRVRSQHPPFGRTGPLGRDIVAVHAVAGRMVGGHVEGVKIMELILKLRAAFDIEPQTLKHVADFELHAG